MAVLGIIQKDFPRAIIVIVHIKSDQSHILLLTHTLKVNGENTFGYNKRNSIG